jgi:hypothetical protein
LTPVANLPLVTTTQAAKFATSSAGVVDTGGKFATGVNYTGVKFAPSANNAGCKFAIIVNYTGRKQWEQYRIADNLK